MIPTPLLCPVCGKDVSLTEVHLFNITTGRGLSTWARCGGCRSYFDADPYDREAEVSHTRTCSWGNYEAAVKLNLFKRRMYLSTLNLLGRHAHPGASILDVGCSFGGFLEQARIHGFAPRGMDIVPEAVEYTRQQGIPCELAASIEELNLAGDSMDIISVMDCNYYWRDQRTELRAAWRKLRPSGLLVMRLVDKSWMLTAGLAMRKILSGLSGRVCEKAVNDHRVSIPLPTMVGLLREEGFELVHTSIWSALHSDSSSAAVKASFAIGLAVWHLTGWNLAPGALVLARKRPCKSS
jgi:2-polyprenyl-3-methyl-5-hydroxy-6-metoxy-1,4-benzoquinol methylase